jgi:dephospho-CoA kinase
VIVVGLTGSIGMGKSVLARQIKRLGFPVHEADKAVHKLLGVGGKAVSKVAKIFPEALQNNAIDRQILGRIVFKNPAARKSLEKILHPLVRRDSEDFLKICRLKGFKIAVLDVPLLFETRQSQRFDYIICVTAPQFVQTRRVLSRQGMTAERLRAVLNLQMPDAVKRRQADTVICTARGYSASLRDVQKLMKMLRDDRFRKK